MRIDSENRREVSHLFPDDRIVHSFGGIGSPLPESVYADNMVDMKQAHGIDIAVVHQGDLPDRTTTVSDVDGIVTRDSEVLLTVKTGDCVPVLYYDPKTRLVAASHQGWKGTRANMSQAMVRQLESMGVEPDDLLVAFGASIGPCCNEFSPQDAESFADIYPNYADEIISYFQSSEKPEKPHIDLRRLNWLQLRDAGVRPDRIDARPSCTVCQDDLYFSFRGGSYVGGDPMKTNWSYIMLR